MTCTERGFPHVYRGQEACVICNHPKPRPNAIGLPCVKCHVTLTDRNSYTVDRGNGRHELRCKYCHSRHNNKPRRGVDAQDEHK